MTLLRRAFRRSVRAVTVLTRLSIVLGGVALTISMGLIALLPNVGARAMIVTSGSMEPTINVGGLVIVEEVDPETITVGDVVTYRGYASGGLTTHRVIDRRIVGERLHFRTQGDANDTPDVDLAPAEGVFGKVRLDVPHAGRAMNELTRPELRYVALGGLSAWLLIKNTLALRRALHARALATEEGAKARLAPSIAVALVFVSVAAALTLGATSAAFTGTTTIADNTFVTGTW